MMCPRWLAGATALLLHLRDGRFDESEDAVEVHIHCLPPLCVAHGGDGRVLRRPDAVVNDEDIQLAEVTHSLFDQFDSLPCRAQLLLDG